MDKKIDILKGDNDIIPEHSVFHTHIPRSTKTGHYFLIILVIFLLSLFVAIFYTETRATTSKNIKATKGNLNIQ